MEPLAWVACLEPRMYEEGIVAQSDVEHRCACSIDIFLKTWVCVLSEYISFTGFNVSLDMYLHTLFAFSRP
jgi:hypothetical protein